MPKTLAQRMTIVTLTVLAAGLLWLAWSRHVEERLELWLHGEQPIQFYFALETDLLDDYSRVFGVAHNSGDRLATTRAALDHGADIIEIDVISIDNQLYAAHRTPPWFVRRGIYQGSRLEASWESAAEADVVALDLKESSPRFLNLVARFLDTHREHQVIVMSRDRASFTFLAARVPHAFRFLSIGSTEHFEALRNDPSLVQLIDGTTIRESLLDAETVAWLKERQLLIIAWTVSDLARTNELVELGVDGITTDNLAILELLGGQQRQEALLTWAIQRRGSNTMSMMSQHYNH